MTHASAPSYQWTALHSLSGLDPCRTLMQSLITRASLSEERVSRHKAARKSSPNGLWLLRSVVSFPVGARTDWQIASGTLFRIRNAMRARIAKPVHLGGAQ